MNEKRKVGKWSRVSFEFSYDPVNEEETLVVEFEVEDCIKITKLIPASTCEDWDEVIISYSRIIDEILESKES